MARLFIEHKAVDIPCMYSTNYLSGDKHYYTFSLNACEVSEYDCTYLCFVHEGKCYAARNKNFHSSGKIVVISCIDFSDNVVGKRMILKDYLLGG